MLLWRHLLVKKDVCRLLPLPVDPLGGRLSQAPSPHRLKLPPPPLPMFPCAQQPPPSCSCTRCRVRFNIFLGTGHYFLIPINTCDSIYVQDKFISISFFN